MTKYTHALEYDMHECKYAHTYANLHTYIYVCMFLNQ